MSKRQFFEVSSIVTLAVIQSFLSKMLQARNGEAFPL